MCAIIGALVWDVKGSYQISDINRRLNHILSASLERGRDGRGWFFNYMQWDKTPVWYHKQQARRRTLWGSDLEFVDMPIASGTFISNLRAEPTTEFVASKRDEDQQPYKVGPWTIVHNGTIANDGELRTGLVNTGIDSAAIVEVLAEMDLTGQTGRVVATHFAACMRVLKGSYAILATHDEHPGMMLAACNYRPIWVADAFTGTYFASARHYFPADMVPQMLEPYSAWMFKAGERVRLTSQAQSVMRALVVCSGGLDSVVAATITKASGAHVELVHFRYGSRAEGPEIQAIHAVADHLDVPLHILPMNIYSPDDSPLLRADSTIAGGEAGAEFAHEWVPARNLVMLALATAFAEARGFDTIVLGNNLEEAGAYPDNEPEFINRFNDLLPFAVGDGKRVRVQMPVGNMMKHEIVAAGHAFNAPLDKTWSCYRAGEQHCGTCGPCYMRRTAFQINGLPEVIKYACEEA